MNEPLDMAQQRREWEADLAGVRAGNPYATLCNGCNGRHAPPRNDHCPLALAPPTSPEVWQAPKEEGGARG